MADTALIASRLILAAVFLLAATLKMQSKAPFRDTLTGFGVAAKAAPILAIAIPLAEAILGLALLPNSTAWWGALGMMVMLILFSGVIAANLARGKHPSCNCFGQIRSRPIGPSTLLRNGILGALAAYVVLQGERSNGPDIISQLSHVAPTAWLTVLFLLAIAATAGLGWLVARLLQQQGRLLLRIDDLEMRLGNLGVVPGPGQHKQVMGLTPGTVAPSFAIDRLEGVATSLEELKKSAQPLLLLFSDANCAPCNALLPKLSLWFEKYADRVSIYLVTRGSPVDIRAKMNVDGLKAHLHRVLVQKDREVAGLYQSNATPSAVLINPLGLIDSYLAIGEKDISDLVSELSARTRLSPASRDSRALRSPSLVTRKASA